MNKEQYSIGMVTVLHSYSQAGITPLSDLVDIMQAISNKNYLILVNVKNDLFKDNLNVSTYRIKHISGSNVFTRIIKYIFLQLRISYNLMKIARKVDIWIFFIEGETLVLPMLSAKILKRKVIIASAGSHIQALKSANDSFFRIVGVLSKINCALSNCIILYSPNLIKEWDLEKHKNKISIAHHHFFDFDKFKIKKKFDARKNLVGYIGRLSEEKGVLNFVKAIPKVIKKGEDLEFLIGGDGRLRDEIERYLEGENLNGKVKLPGWVPREEFLTYLNELKLFVLPSYTEGLPCTILEAMACGTPVLATPVGAIPDVIKDGETGFIMENNSPECIAENIVRALAHPNINEITKNARALIEEKYNYQAAVDGYRIILSSTF